MVSSVQDFYKSILEKRAGKIDQFGPDYSLDNQEIATSELSDNKSDQRSELNSLFDSSSSVQKADSKLIGKTLPDAKKSDDVSTSNPMLKLAVNMAFFEGLRSTGILKTADSNFLKIAYAAFEDELEKLGAWVGSQGAVLRQALNAARKPSASATVRQSQTAASPAAGPRIVRVGGGKGSGVWQLSKSASFGGALKSIGSKMKSKPKTWGPGTVVQGKSLAGGGVPGTRPSSINWGAYAPK
jgi:hypothetical protein